MAEWLGTGLQNQVQQFDSAWYLIKKTDKSVGFFYEVPFHPTAARSPSRGKCRFQLRRKRVAPWLLSFGHSHTPPRR